MFDSKNFSEIEKLLTNRREFNGVTEELKEYFSNKTVLVTGAGGSIGSAIVEQLLECSPKKVICLENSEFNLFKLEANLEAIDTKTEIDTRYIDIRDDSSIEWLFKNNKIDIVFHSAALKHVKIVEENREEAVKTNVIATYKLMRIAAEYNVSEFLFVSTDKVVEKSSFMGKTKKIGEYLCGHFSKEKTSTFLNVRFGNVIGSSGSVIPIFIERIKENKPLIIRDFRAKRYFMSISEAIFLVLKATAEGINGESYILKMGEQIFIKEVAEKILEYMDAENRELIETSLLPGENLDESLMTKDEKEVSKETSNFYIFKNDSLPEIVREIICELEKSYMNLEKITKMIDTI